jgi:hypothetical protein
LIVGLDLSLRGLGMVAVPPAWDLDWKRVRFKSLAYELRGTATPREQVARLEALSRDVVAWCVRRGASQVWIEDQPSYVPANTIHSLKKNSELRGVVRVELARAGFDAEFIDETSARKLLLGWIPGKDRKACVVEALKAAGDPFDYDDERDAFTVANWGLHELGAPCLTGLLGEKPVRAKKPRVRKKSQTAGYLDVIAGGAG